MTTRLSALFAALLVIACGTSTPTSFEIPFENRSLGAGAVPTALVLPRGEEASIVGAALLDALQEMNFGIVRPPLAAGSSLPQQKWIDTDIVPLTAEQVARLSAASGAALPTDRQLGAAHKLQYAVRDGRIHVLTGVQLYQRGALSSAWTEYRGTYQNTPLLDELRRRLEARLAARTPS